MKTKKSTIVIEMESYSCLGRKFIVFPSGMDDGFTFWEKDNNIIPNHSKGYWNRNTDCFSKKQRRTLKEFKQVVKHFPGLAALKKI